MKLLLIIGSIVFSLLALVIVHLIATKKIKKTYLAAAVFLESIVILCLMTHQPGYFGLCAAVGLIPIIKSIRK